jgi:F0F1-type ATP synthase epsilon subunit
MTLLGRGQLRVRRGDSVSEFKVHGGFLQVVGDRVRVVAEHVQGGGA